MPRAAAHRSGQSYLPSAKQQRLKTGCFTCRIRRKKCDENKNRDTNACRVCERLSIQCLGGYGRKRKDNNKLTNPTQVNAWKKNIKDFLNSRGNARSRGDLYIINGILILDRDTYQPAGNLLEHPNSSVDTTPAGSPNSDNNGLLTLEPQFTRHKPEVADDKFASILGPMPSELPHDLYNQVAGTRPEQEFNSDNYFSGEEQFQEAFTNSHSGIGMIPSNLSLVHSWSLEPGTAMFDQIYKNKTIQIQYLLADRASWSTLISMLQDGSGCATESARILAEVHYHREKKHQFVRQQAPVFYRVQKLYSNIAGRSQYLYDEETVITSINVVSVVLFDGGMGGEWQAWLEFGLEQARLFFSTIPGDPCKLLRTCNDTTRHLIKTVIWFDVLGAITLKTVPAGHRYINQLFGPSQGTQNEMQSSHNLIPTSKSSRGQRVYDKLSMLDTMGCDSIVTWALAEISCLSVWKDTELLGGRLCRIELVKKGEVIQRELTKWAEVHAASSAAGSSTMPSDTNVGARDITAKLYTSAAEVYLQSVISDDFPHVRGLQASVTKILTELESVSISGNPGLISSVVRSAVFPVFIACALAANTSVARQTMNLLIRKSGAGNCMSIYRLLDGILMEREITLGQARPVVAVNWRKKLWENKMLLV